MMSPDPGIIENESPSSFPPSRELSRHLCGVGAWVSPVDKCIFCFPEAPKHLTRLSQRPFVIDEGFPILPSSLHSLWARLAGLAFWHTRLDML